MTSQPDYFKLIENNLPLPYDAKFLKSELVGGELLTKFIVTQLYKYDVYGHMMGRIIYHLNNKSEDIDYNINGVVLDKDEKVNTLVTFENFVEIIDNAKQCIRLGLQLLFVHPNKKDFGPDVRGFLQIDKMNDFEKLNKVIDRMFYVNDLDFQDTQKALSPINEYQTELVLTRYKV